MRNRIVVNIYPTMPGTKWLPRARWEVSKMLNRNIVSNNKMLNINIVLNYKMINRIIVSDYKIGLPKFLI
jgi:hypothetical protein